MTTERTTRVKMTDTRLEKRMIALRKEMDELDAEVTRCRTRLHVLVKQAVSAGEPVTAVATASGYHRQRVFQLTTEVHE
jgi:hypothetical protein